jgi:hypothetical protein
MAIRESNDPLVGACRDGDIEGGSLGHRHIISVVDRPSFHLCIVHGIYWMVVVYAPAVSGIPVCVTESTASGSSLVSRSSR